MLELPQRHSLVNQTAAALRKGIRSGEWQSLLPGERVLAAKLPKRRRGAPNAPSRLRVIPSGDGPSPNGFPVSR